MATKIGEALIARALELMRDGRERDYYDLAHDLGVSAQSGLNVSKILHARKLVFVCNGRKAPSNGLIRPVYRIGNEPDATTLKRIKPADEGRQYLKSEREWLEESRASGSVVFRHPQDVAFFGEYRGSRA
jgi:hypothetical protein